MSWKDLLAETEETQIFPWTGGRVLRSGERTWTIFGACPTEENWCAFSCSGNRRSRYLGQAEPQPEALRFVVQGYLVGDRMVPDDARVDTDPDKIAGQTERVHLIEAGLDRFVRVSAGRLFETGPLVYRWREFPLGSENTVLEAYLDEKTDLDAIRGVTPALDAAFRMEVFQRAEARRRRAEVERRQREEEQRRAAEEARRRADPTTGRRSRAPPDGRGGLRRSGASSPGRRRRHLPRS